MADFSSIVGTVQQSAEQNGDSIKQGMDLYQEGQKVQQQSIQNQQAQDNLDQARFNTANTNLSLLARTNPTIAKRMVPKIYDNLTKAGISIDRGILDTLASDDAYKQRFTNIANLVSGLANTPEGVQQGLQAFDDIGAWDKGVSALETQQKQKAAQDLADTTAGTAEEVANTKADAQKYAADRKASAAGASTGLRLDTAEARAAKNITTDTDVVGLTKSVQQAQKDYDLIQEAKTHGLTPLKAHELVQSYVGLLKGQASGSVGEERKALEKSALDLETRGNTWLQSLKPNGIVHYDDQPFLQEMESSVRGIHGTLKNSLGKRTDALTRKSSYDSINQAQADAKQKVMAGAELSSPTPTGTPPPSKWTAAQKAQFTANALKANHSQADIDAYLAGK